MLKMPLGLQPGSASPVGLREADVADELATGVGGKRRLAGAGQTEEHGGLASHGINVGGAVHGQDAVFDGEQVAHRGEDALLDLAGVAGTGDDDTAGLEVEHDGGVALDASGEVV